MRLIATVYTALLRIDHACTRAEIETKTGLGKDEVHKGLLGLRRRHALLTLGGERERARYRLKPGATPPEDLRGGSRANGGEVPAALDGACDSGFRAPRPPSHRSESGVLRVTKQRATVAPPCLLAQVWRPR